ncbi:cytochrome c biogenesis protein ResB [Mycetocola manganoxydans]|uniref:Cytochrome c biogenesis protein ResB n=1 Tax=Mycetocola manganoxydans TaxID=699879 RepID=A0A3L6ZKV4_9MICO|nr:cytochrome c biogenesis protein ResB [Mycetocola manganoxydans]RLP68520.1 cytochrome c biogenesis protein ResB [Mycetocola manganoxydans]GHD51978.1 cytochrome c biogenesis protein ResB [Mycetocola manganoxydans]
MSRPSDYVDAGARPQAEGPGDGIVQPKLGFVGTLRFIWRQLTSMRTALLLLLLLAVAAVPGSLVPQRSSDPNGVIQYFDNNPDLAPMLESIQMFDVYGSVWFSSIYLLLFVSLIGCVIPRTKHHFQAMRSRPPRTPARLQRLAAHTEVTLEGGNAGTAIESAHALLKKSGYRTELYQGRNGDVSVSAERGYLRETGNLVFHSALVGMLLTVGIGGGFGYAAQRVIVEGQTFVNTLLDYNSFNPGRFYNPDDLAPFAMTLDKFDVTYEQKNLNAYGQPIDFTTRVTMRLPTGETEKRVVRVNDPLRFEGADIYLLGNGYAPKITVRDPEGSVVWTDSVPFLPQDGNLTSLGVIKIPDGLDEQIGMIGFLYPTAYKMETGAYTSTYPDLVFPVLTLNVFAGDLGINDGAPKSVYELNVDDMTQLSGGESGVDSIELMPGQSQELPDGRGTITFENVNPDAGAPADQDATTTDYAGSVARFASFDVHTDPTVGWVLTFAILILGGLLTSLFVPRRRVWIKATDNADGTVRVEYAGLARGEDPGLGEAVDALAFRHGTALGLQR